MLLFSEKKRRSWFLPVLIVVLCFLFPLAPPAHADNIGLLMRGVGRTLFSVFQLPLEMIKDAPRAFPFGLLVGTIGGTMKMVAGTLMGVTDIARGAAPYAKYMIFFV